MFNKVNDRISFMRHKFHVQVIRSRATNQSYTLLVERIWLHHQTCYPWPDQFTMAGVRVKTVLTSLNTAFLPISRSRYLSAYLSFV